MKKAALNLTLLLIALMITTLVQAGKPPARDEIYFEARFEGAVVGDTISDPTRLQGNTLLLGFRNGVDFRSGFIDALEQSGYSGFSDCFGGGMSGVTIQVYADYVEQDLAVARFWFWAFDKQGPDFPGQEPDVHYALTVTDTVAPLVWSGSFPPGEQETIDRTAEHWEIGPTKKSNKTTCSGGGDLDPSDEAMVTLGRLP